MKTDDFRGKEERERGMKKWRKGSKDGEDARRKEKRNRWKKKRNCS